METGPKSMTKTFKSSYIQNDNFEHWRIIDVFQMGVSWPVNFTKQNQQKERKQFRAGNLRKVFCLSIISSFHILEYNSLYSWFLEKKIASLKISSLEIFVMSMNVNFKCNVLKNIL